LLPLDPPENISHHCLSAFATSDLPSIAYINHFPTFGGPHNRALRLYGPLRDSGWKLHIVVPTEPGNAAGRYADAGIPVTHLPLQRVRISRSPRLHARYLRGLVPEILLLRRFLRDNAIDVLINPSLENLHGPVAARLEKLACITQIIQTVIPPVGRYALMPPTVALSDVIMTTGISVAREYPLTSRLGDRLVPFFSPVDTDEFRPSPERRVSARESLGLPLDAPVVGYVSNLLPPKGHLTFLRAASSILEQRPDAKFVLLGNQPAKHREYVADLIRQASALGLSHERGNLIVRDPGRGVAHLAPAFDIFLMTAEKRSEGVPTVILEALAMGLPVVATRVAGVPDIVEHGTNGLLAPPRDHEGLAREVVSLLDDDDRRARFGRAARRTAETKLTLQRCLETHLGALGGAIRHASQARQTAVSPEALRWAFAQSPAGSALALATPLPDSVK
jgi:glycosyltransferase involved in cell wall biosynthesis